MKLPIRPCIWLNDTAEEAADFYTGLFPDSHILSTEYYTAIGREVHGHEPGEVLLIEVMLNGQAFTLLNGGPTFTPSEGLSLQIFCADQAELDTYWEELSVVPEAEQCGWLKDRYGVSWQVVPEQLGEIMGGSDAEGRDRATEALFAMKKIDIAALQRAYDGT